MTDDASQLMDNCNDDILAQGAFPWKTCNKILFPTVCLSIQYSYPSVIASNLSGMANKRGGLFGFQELHQIKIFAQQERIRSRILEK